MSKIKICFVTTTPLIIHFFLKNLLIRLADDYEVTVVLRIDDDFQLISELQNKIKFRNVNINRKIDIFSDVRALICLYFHIRKDKYDVVHTIAPKAGLLGQLAAFACGVNVRLHTFQGEVWATKRGISRFFFRKLDQFCALMATYSLVVSKSERAFLIEHGVLNSINSCVLGYGSISGVNLNHYKYSYSERLRMRNKFGYKDSDVVLLFVGRLNADKGIETLLNAFNAVALHDQNIHLLVVGRDEGGWSLRINSGEYSNRIRYVGFKIDTRKYYQISDMLCLPSKREGFGMVILEAAAYKLPSVCTRIYGITDAIVEGETGLLFEKFDELVYKISDLATNIHLREKLGLNAYRRLINCFDEKFLIHEYINLYFHLTKKHD